MRPAVYFIILFVQNNQKAAEIRRLMIRVTVLSIPDYVGCAVAFGPFFVPARGLFACGAPESYRRRVASAPIECVSGNLFNA